jgi:hypothetical protein
MRLTEASATPGVRDSVRWTRLWQAAQVIPLTGMTILLPGSGFVAAGAAVFFVDGMG